MLIKADIVLLSNFKSSEFCIKTNVLSFCVQKTNLIGVWFDKGRSKWATQIRHEKKSYFCGYFSTELVAAQAVNAKCVELYIPLKNPGVGLPQVRFA